MIPNTVEEWRILDPFKDAIVWRKKFINVAVSGLHFFSLMYEVLVWDAVSFSTPWESVMSWFPMFQNSVHERGKAFAHVILSFREYAT